MFAQPGDHRRIATSRSDHARPRGRFTPPTIDPGAFIDGKSLLHEAVQHAHLCAVRTGASIDHPTIANAAHAVVHRASIHRNARHPHPDFNVGCWQTATGDAQLNAFSLVGHLFVTVAILDTLDLCIR